MLSKSQSVEFINQSGHRLAAKIEFPPDQKPIAFAIFAHCFTCNKNLSAVTERLKIRREGEQVYYIDKEIKHRVSEDAVVSMNFWGFHPTFLKDLESGFENFVRNNITNLKAEYYIPIIVDELIKAGKSEFKVLNSEDNWYGVTYKADKDEVVEALRLLHIAGHYPAILW